MSRHNDGRPILAYETTYRNETQKRVATFPMKLGVRARGRKRGRREGGSFVFFFILHSYKRYVIIFATEGNQKRNRPFTRPIFPV